MFNTTVQSINKYFGSSVLWNNGTPIKPGATKGFSTVSEGFVAIANVLQEANVEAEQANYVLSKLYDAKLAVDSAIITGIGANKATHY